MREPLLTIYNRHAAECGIPPMVSNDPPDLYMGYFENLHGEQWLFTFDRRTCEATLRGGDVGWENAYPVRDGRVAGLILGGPEATWLDACWSAVEQPG